MLDSLPASMKSAKLAGSQFYFTGKVCPKDHLAKRRTINGQCMDCEKIKSSVYYEKHKEERKSYDRNYYRKNHNKCRATRLNYLIENPNKAKGWIRENSQLVKISCMKWRNKNRARLNALGAKRRAKLLQRIPKWADLEAIRLVYLNCPKGMEVDHIIPLQGVLVSGLHVLNNLQYLTPSENASKRHFFNPFEWEEHVR